MKPARFNIAALLLLTVTSVSLLRAQSVSVYATGLDGPRGLKFGPDGALYVAEAGRGGSNGPFNCEQTPPPVGPYHGGLTARISKITGPGQVTTVVSGLPSGISSLPSGDTQGASDVAFIENTLFVLLAGRGLSHGNPETPNGVIRVDVTHGTWSYVADLSAFLAASVATQNRPLMATSKPAIN